MMIDLVLHEVPEGHKCEDVKQHLRYQEVTGHQRQIVLEKLNSSPKLFLIQNKDKGTLLFLTYHRDWVS